jgi:hypothetical protein
MSMKFPNKKLFKNIKSIKSIDLKVLCKEAQFLETIYNTNMSVLEDENS